MLDECMRAVLRLENLIGIGPALLEIGATAVAGI